jgi:adenine-specific DNA-methyltransferase
MKYMGSKRFMLNNGLGELIRAQLPYARRVVDPFCGAGSVVYFVAQNSGKRIIAGDLQKYAVVLANAVIGRNYPVDIKWLEDSWLTATEKRLHSSALFARSTALSDRWSHDVESWVKSSRHLCKTRSSIGPVWNTYGGYYFSPKQALTIDYLIKYLPEGSQSTDLCLAALIMAATRCAASPGHTAQPFQPTKTASRFIKVAWDLNVMKSCANALKELAPIHAKVKGKAVVSSAQQLVTQLTKGDLVIIDPPYSGVQYSRFYHVLETIARGKCGPVSGGGRYPSISERPQSAFSKAGQSLEALDELMAELAKRGTTVIFTFPKGECSNGLSGTKIIEVARKWFRIDKASKIHGHDVIVGRFSTLGGNNRMRLSGNRLKTARIKSEELLLLLKPKINLKSFKEAQTTA